MRVKYPLENIFEDSSDDDDDEEEFDTKNVPWVVRWKEGWSSFYFIVYQFM